MIDSIDGVTRETLRKAHEILNGDSDGYYEEAERLASEKEPEAVQDRSYVRQFWPDQRRTFDGLERQRVRRWRACMRM